MCCVILAKFQKNTPVMASFQIRPENLNNTILIQSPAAEHCMNSLMPGLIIRINSSPI